MRLTTKGRFAVTAMIDLALREHTGPVALAAIRHGVVRPPARRRGGSGS